MYIPPVLFAFLLALSANGFSIGFTSTKAAADRAAAAIAELCRSALTGSAKFCQIRADGSMRVLLPL
jgi:hypothetical protein